MEKANINSALTPEEEAQAVRDRFTEIQAEISRTKDYLCELQEEYEYLGEQVAILDRFGPEALFSSPDDNRTFNFQPGTYIF